MPPTRKKIAAALKGRQASAVNWLDDNVHVQNDTNRISFSPGDLITTSIPLSLSGEVIDGHHVFRLSQRDDANIHDEPTFAGAPFAVYLGSERLRLTRRMKGKGWRAGPRDNEHFHELHHVFLVDQYRAVIPGEIIHRLSAVT